MEMLVDSFLSYFGYELDFEIYFFFLGGCFFSWSVIMILYKTMASWWITIEQHTDDHRPHSLNDIY